MLQCIDQTGRTVQLKNFPPSRIVSVVPSQTELLHHLGLDAAVVGITKFCVHPKSWFQSKQRVGGTKSLHLDVIRDLQPDLIIANKEENQKEQVEAMMEIAPVWISDIETMRDAMNMIAEVGRITGKEEKANELTRDIEQGFSNTTTSHLVDAVYLIWNNPYMTIGGDTFISHMMSYAGCRNIFENEKRYPEISVEKLVTLNPPLVLLSSEPFPFKEKHAKELAALLPHAKLLFVDGEMFSWYGSRLLYAAQYMKELKEKIAQINSSGSVWA